MQEKYYNWDMNIFSHKYCVTWRQGLFGVFLCLSVGLVLPVNAQIQPNDPEFSTQWYLDSINAPLAWNSTTGTRKIVVAVLDTGIEVIHPDLQENIWTNLLETYNGLDDDNNGYIDDVHGWNFIDNQSNPGPDMEAIFTTVGGLNHGTIVAGLIGELGNNATDGVGVSWQVSLMSLRVLDNEGVGLATDVAKAIDYAIDKHADIINMSFVGVNPSEELRDAIWRAHAAGIVIVAAGGNGADKKSVGNLNVNPQYPVCYVGPNGEHSNVIGVAALDKFDQKTDFSDYGSSCIDIAAPGDEMPGALLYAPNRPDLIKSFGGNWSGTSLAAPLVTGSIVLLKSLKPDLTPGEIYQILTDSAKTLPSYGLSMGAGKLDIGAAVELLKKSYLPIEPKKDELIVYRTSKVKPVKFFSVQGDEKEFVGFVENLTRKILPKKVISAYNRYTGKLAIVQADLDGDGEKEFITVKPGVNPVAKVWTLNGLKKSEIKINGITMCENHV